MFNKISFQCQIHARLAKIPPYSPQVLIICNNFVIVIKRTQYKFWVIFLLFFRNDMIKVTFFFDDLDVEVVEDQEYYFVSILISMVGM